MAFRLDPTSGVPTYLQIVQQVEHALRLGYLKPGRPAAQGPRGRRRAGHQPEHRPEGLPRPGAQGLASGRPGRGTFIDASLGDATLPALADLRRSLRKWLAKADEAGLDEEGIVALVTSTLRDFSERRDVEDMRGDAAHSAERPEVSHERRRDRRPRAAATAARGRCRTAPWPSRPAGWSR